MTDASTSTDGRFYITLLRHGESVGNAEARFQGQSDFSLTELGREQSRALAAYWVSNPSPISSLLITP